MKKYAEEQDFPVCQTKRKKWGWLCHMILSGNFTSLQSDMPLDGIHKGSKREEDGEIHGEDPLKEKHSRWTLMGTVTDVIL